MRILILFICFLFVNCSKTNKTYICPPCNSDCDTLLFKESGICPSCKMSLVLKQDKSALSETEKIDKLLEIYNYDSVPGLAVGVFKNGKIIYSKGFGSANLDYKIPNTADSKFYIGSMAKQFAGAALLKLSHEGKLDFSKEIQEYLPDFPKYKYPITVAQIIHHTSGIRGTSSLQLISGIADGYEEFFSAEQQYQMLKNQKELNFIPGTEYRYSSGGYIILAMLIERVSGKSFRKYIDENIFKPLNMENSFVIDNHREIVKNRVISYFKNGEKFERRSMVFDGKGDGSILTTINDLVKWNNAFYDDSLLGIPNFAEKMYTSGKLNNGMEVNYGMALSTYNYNGFEMISHNGGMLGFRADLIRFPEQHLSIAVLANRGDVHSTGVAETIAGYYLENSISSKNQEVKDQPKYQVYKSINQDLQKRIGKYFSADINQWRRISFENDTLYYDSGDLTFKSPLLPIGQDKFYLKSLDRLLNFDGNKLIMDYKTHKHELVKFNDEKPTLEDLKLLSGTYYSEELKALYTFYVDNNKFMMTVNNDLPKEVFPNPKDERINWNSKDKVWIGYAMVRFEKDENNTFNRILIGDNRVKEVEFKKLKLN